MSDIVLFSKGLHFVRLLSISALLFLAGFGNVPVARAQKESTKPHSVTIQWASAQPPVAGYFVYRGSGSGKPARLTPTRISETEYTDRTVVAGQTYSYFVTSVNSKGAESKPSQLITATIPSP